jgi:cytochrome b6-f complex iron-sulfur subunit
MAEPNQPLSENQPPPVLPSAVTASPPPVQATTAVTAAAPPRPPALPPKPPAKAAVKSRRFFLFALVGSWFAAAWVAFTVSMIGLTLGTLRFLFPNVLSEPPTTFKAGYIANFEENKVDDKFKEVGSWVIRARDERGREIVYALSTTCTHLGCTPNWLEGEKKFKCPCHGSGFKMSGVNFEGPAPRPLERYAIRKTEDGQIVVDKSRKFQRELGQWEDADSYILL